MEQRSVTKSGTSLKLLIGLMSPGPLEAFSGKTYTGSYGPTSGLSKGGGGGPSSLLLFVHQFTSCRLCAKCQNISVVYMY